MLPLPSHHVFHELPVSPLSCLCRRRAVRVHMLLVPQVLRTTERFESGSYRPRVFQR